MANIVVSCGGGTAITGAVAAHPITPQTSGRRRARPAARGSEGTAPARTLGPTWQITPRSSATDDPEKFKLNGLEWIRCELGSVTQGLRVSGLGINQ